MLVSCLLPTFNRFPRLAYLLEEAVECFLQQNYPHKELIILNDTPGQHITYSHPQVRVINASYRFTTLGEKLHWMLEQAQGEYICRWDDDDLSLPWRLSYSVARLFYGPEARTRDVFLPPETSPMLNEWRPENHWYYARGSLPRVTEHPGNTHIMGIWHRGLILNRGLKYPSKVCESGAEDQTFNKHLWDIGYPRHGDLLPLEDIFYLYRWGTGSQHLSGNGNMQALYDKLGTSITEGQFVIHPRFHANHLANIQEAIDHIRHWESKVRPQNS